MVHIYYMKLDSDCSQEQSLALLYGEEKSITISGTQKELYQLLPQERREVVDRAKNETVARKRLYTGAFLQYVLSEETGLPMEELYYEYNEWGKPELAQECLEQMITPDNEIELQAAKERDGRLYFNLSHSGDYVVLAVSDSPVGIDIEHKTKGYDSLAKRCFCEEEYKDILSAGDTDEQKHRFLEYWTMKEAYIKLVGEGMRIPLNSFLIQREQAGFAFVSEHRADGNMIAKRCEEYFATIMLDSEYCVSLCTNQKLDAEKILSIKEKKCFGSISHAK